MQTPFDDYTAIVNLVSRYFRCLDSKQLDSMRDCFASEFTASHTLVGTVAGPEAFIQLAQTSFPGLAATQHYCSNLEIEINAHKAVCRSYLFAQHVLEVGGRIELAPGGGRYIHELERAEHGWIISRLQNDVTWMDPRLADTFRRDRT